jgi:hypothetical protein
MKRFNVTQGTPEWHRLRRGVVTASEVDALITPEWRARTGEGVRTYLCQKLAERLMAPEPADAEDVGGAPSWAADQGHVLEEMALPWFEFETGLHVERVGFCLSDDGQIGCSPDGLIGEDSGIETKCPQPANQVRYLLAGGVPKQYHAQVHFSMLVTGRPSWWFVSYSRDLPKLAVRVDRDEGIQAKLREVVAAFLDQMDRELPRLLELSQVEHAAFAGGEEQESNPF